MNNIIMYGLVFKNNIPIATFSAPYVVRPDGIEEFDIPPLVDYDKDYNKEDHYEIEVLEVIINDLDEDWL